MELKYDSHSNTFKAHQPVETTADSTQDSLLPETAALDVGANNLTACTVSTGHQYLYKGRDVFQQFREVTENIAYHQSLLDDDTYTSKRIESLYRTRTRRRDHAQDALIRDLVDKLVDHNVGTVIVGDLKNVLETHWSCTVNEKTHNFWAYNRFTERLENVCEEYGITVKQVGEQYSSQECPECGEREKTRRNGDNFTCHCGFEGHSDVKASRVLLQRETGGEVRPMARPVCLQWDNQEWRSVRDASVNTNKEHTNRSTRSVGNLASSGIST